MARVPDTPCAVCGKLLWGGTTSLPAGERTCRSCRRSRPGYVAKLERVQPEPRSCRTCGATYTPKRNTEQSYYCSRGCRDRSDDARQRHREKARQRKDASSDRDYVDADIFERDRWRCGICSQRIGRSYSWPHPRSVSIDHIVPLTADGKDVAANVQAAHLVCNTRKNNRATGDQLRLVG